MIQIDNPVNIGEDMYVLIGGDEPLGAFIEKYHLDEIRIDNMGIVHYVDNTTHKDPVVVSQNNVIRGSHEEVNQILIDLLYNKVKWEDLIHGSKRRGQIIQNNSEVR